MNRVLITAGPTHEPIDEVRYIANRSSGRMGAALALAALARGCATTLILGPVAIPIAAAVRRIDVETSAQMQQSVENEFPRHDLLIMAAAVADFRPRSVHDGKFPRPDVAAGAAWSLELEATPDIVAIASSTKRPDQRVIGFSLESGGNIERARQKLLRKRLDLIVYNPPHTMNSDRIEAILLYPDGRCEDAGSRPKAEFADILMHRGLALLGTDLPEGLTGSR